MPMSAPDRANDPRRKANPLRPLIIPLTKEYARTFPNATAIENFDRMGVTDAAHDETFRRAVLGTKREIQQNYGSGVIRAGKVVKGSDDFKEDWKNRK